MQSTCISFIKIKSNCWNYFANDYTSSRKLYVNAKSHTNCEKSSKIRKDETILKDGIILQISQPAEIIFGCVLFSPWCELLKTVAKRIINDGLVCKENCIKWNHADIYKKRRSSIKQLAKDDNERSLIYSKRKQKNMIIFYMQNKLENVSWREKSN